MAQATVTTTGGVLVAADPTQERIVLVENLGPTNYIALEIGSLPTIGTGMEVAAGATSPAINLPPEEALYAIANTASCDVRYLVS